MDITERPGWERVEVGSVVLARHVASGNLFRLCSRCGGSGQYSFNPMDGTRCFGCSGRGLGQETTVEDEERRAKQRAKAADRRAAKAAQEAAEAAEVAEQWRKAYAPALARLAEYSEHNDFLAELVAKAEHQPLTNRQVAAGLQAATREEQRRQVKERQRAAGHFGTVKEKIPPTEVELISAKWFPTERYDRASQYLVTMRTAEGHVLKTWTSGQFGYDVDEALQRCPSGTLWTITGTVKEHGEYNGTPETTLINCKRILPKEQ